jgi:hypothetical protein
MLVVILVAVGEVPATLFWVAVLCFAALSIAFALVAVGGAMTNTQLGGGRRLWILAFALAVLIAFAFAIIAIWNDADFE